MKKLTFILFICLISLSCNNSITLLRINKDNSEISNIYPANTKKLSIIDNDGNNCKTVNIKGLENFKKLEEISFYCLVFLEDFSFLKDINSSCKRLYFVRSNFFGFENISHLKNLEEIEFDGYITDEQFNSLLKNGIDLNCFPKLKKLTFQLEEKKIRFFKDKNNS